MKILIADRIAELMKSEKLTQTELSKRLHVGQSSISEWLSGKKEPSVASLWLLADYFDTDIDYLVGRKEY